MATYIFDDLANGSQIAFDPLNDVLVVQNPGVVAGHILIDHSGTSAANTRFHIDLGPFGGRSVFLLNVQPEELTQANFSLAGAGWS